MMGWSCQGSPPAQFYGLSVYGRCDVWRGLS